MADNIIYWQHTLQLPVQSRGVHLITDLVVQDMQRCPKIDIGLMNLFIQHTSASLSITENTCHDVRYDLEDAINRLAPDDNRLYRHTLEGEDDMPAHIKNALLGASVTIPIQNHALVLGQWQGIVLCEHRNHATARKVIMTAHGKSTS
tara:strand:+ start:1056 stop:1499 length:444 start_codon:yes stop_codon:yes gene_type:complete